MFLEELANVLLKRTGVNEHTIEWEEGKQPPYGPIYSLGPVELKTLKTYIKTNLANSFIRASKSLAGAPILFICKLDGSFCFCVDYQELNNFRIKNWYLLPVIGKFLDWLGRAKQFTQLNLISTYYQMRIKESDEEKTAFWTRYSHFEYRVMTFGLSNASASFQGYINKIPAEKLNIFVIVYPDNIFIYTKDLGQAHVNAI